ncbi:MAG: DMT family transporter [Sandaracinus sp.]
MRILSGALVLVLLARGRARAHGDLASAAWLFAYALPFSLAYVRVGGATGALLLFGAVQLTMFGAAIVRGERPGARTYVGLLAAAAGLVVLVLPGARAPDLVGTGLMLAAGTAWGAYSLRGRGATDALGATAGNFVRAAPLALGAWAIAWANGATLASPLGLALAAASGALASGIGYALWYAVMPSLGATRAAIVQLSVPVIAALGAVPILGETLGLRWLVAGGLVLAGISVAITSRAPARR